MAPRPPSARLPHGTTHAFRMLAALRSTYLRYDIPHAFRTPAVLHCACIPHALRMHFSYVLHARLPACRNVIHCLPPCIPTLSARLPHGIPAHFDAFRMGQSQRVHAQSPSIPHARHTACHTPGRTACLIALCSICNSRAQNSIVLASRPRGDRCLPCKCPALVPAPVRCAAYCCAACCHRRQRCPALGGIGNWTIDAAAAAHNYHHGL